jgi:hypothetical protein
MVRAGQGRSENKSDSPTTASLFYVAAEGCRARPGSGGRRAAICCRRTITLAGHVRAAVNKTSEAAIGLAVSSVLSLRSPRSIPSGTPIDAARSGP